jgi:PAS domain S-box-containing protein
MEKSTTIPWPKYPSRPVIISGEKTGILADAPSGINMPGTKGQGEVAGGMAGAIRVLYVDDETSLLDISKLFLEKAGDFSVTTASSAADAIRLLNHEHFDVIISDYQMPGMDGIKFLVGVRKHFGSIPFILFTGRGREEVVIQAINSGADFYLQKGGEPTAQFAELSNKIRYAVSRRRAEEAIRKSEEKARGSEEFLLAVITNAKEGIIVYDHELRITLWNRFMEELTGMKAADVQEKKAADIFPFLKEKGIDLLMQQALTGVTTESFDFEFSIQSTGKKGWARSIYSPNYDTHGTIIGVIAIVSDITERKRAEIELRAANEQIAAAEEVSRSRYDELKQNQQILRQSEEKFRDIFDLINDGILINEIDPEGRLGKFVDVNSVACRMLQYTREDLLAHGPLDFVTGYHSRSFDEILGELTSNGHAIFEIEHRRKDGTIIPIELNVHVVSLQGRQVAISVIRDVTGRKRMDEKLRERTSQIRALIDNLPFDTWAMDCSGRYILQNKASVGHWGDRIGKYPCHIPLPADLLEHWQANNQRALRGETMRGEFSVPVKRGVRTYDEIIAPICVGDKITGITGVNIDITERKTTEEALRQANRNLALLTNITRHDINNQLVALNGFVDLLHEKIHDPALEEYFTWIFQVSTRISSMVQFTKTYDAIGETAPVWQDTRTLVDTAAKEVSLGKVQIKNDLPSGTELFADPLIVKVIYNLMDNAVRYGGKITTIRFSVEERDGAHVVVCEDDGEGIPAADKERIFDQGFGKHTGLGLTFSREILNITGITIHETGTPGKGARFEMTIPKGTYRFR